MKTVYKPWGKEIWLELNDKYCYKRIYIRRGHRTSFQYHVNKIETNYIIDGEAEVWLEDDNGTIQKTTMGADSTFTVMPPKKHRIIANTDVILQEVSTPEVDDVIRIDDDSHRPDGRLDHEHCSPVLCILSAGQGVRLGSVGKKINKGLLPIRNKAVISHMIEKTPLEFDIVIATSYMEQMVKDYCLAAHPGRNFTFVHVECASGPGSGPGRSLYYCKDLLQRPFYLATSDSLIEDALPCLDDNWMGVAPTGVPELYSTADVDENMNVVRFVNKCKDGFKYAFVGLCGILDYNLFWQALESNLTNGELVDVFVDRFPTSAKMFEWTDVGTIDNYAKVRKDFGLLKEDEFTYKVNDRCIKIFADDRIVTGRLHRASHLGKFVPNVMYSGSNVYAYKWQEGKTLYEWNKSDLMLKFLEWYTSQVFEPTNKDISSECYIFYHDKTLRRLNNLLVKKQISVDDSYVINGKQCRSLKEYLDLIDWNSLCAGVATSTFHGDLQFDNILYCDGKFTLLDWRQSFGGSVECGDLYYDFAKLYGGILMPYNLMRSESNFTLVKDNNDVKYTYDKSSELEKFCPVFESWIESKGFNMDKIRILTALIYLNMSPLHTPKLGDLLYFQSQKYLHELLD